MLIHVCDRCEKQIPKGDYAEVNIRFKTPITVDKYREICYRCAQHIIYELEHYVDSIPAGVAMAGNNEFYPYKD